MAIRPERPQTIGGVLDTTFSLYKSSIGSVWPLCLLLALVGMIPALYLYNSVGAVLPNSNDPFAILAVFNRPGYLLSNLLTMILSAWCYGALFLKIHAIGIDAPLGRGMALQSALGRLASLVIVAILAFLAIGIGLVLLVVPGLILTISLLVSWPLVLFEQAGPVTALTGSHRLVWGNWWRTTAILSVGFLIVLVLYTAVGILAGMLVPLVGFGSGSGGGDIVLFGTVLGLVVGVSSNVILAPFFSALVIAVYWDLKLRKHGGDLAARVGALNPP